MPKKDPEFYLLSEQEADGLIFGRPCKRPAPGVSSSEPAVVSSPDAEKRGCPVTKKISIPESTSRWIVFGGDPPVWECLRCGTREKAALPMSVPEFYDKAAEFIDSHLDCKGSKE